MVVNAAVGITIRLLIPKYEKDLNGFLNSKTLIMIAIMLALAYMGSKRPIFIVGEGRSGTTVLRNIIGEHPKIWAVPRESYMFVDKWPQANPYFKKYQSNLEKLVLAVLTSMNRVGVNAHKALSKKEVDTDIKTLEETYTKSQNYQELIQETQGKEINHLKVFDSIASFFTEEAQAHRFIEKTPYHLYYVDEILKFYPDAQIIGIYRDPRAVNLSWLNWQRLKSTVATCSSWNKAMSTMKKLKDKLPEDTFKLIKFEDLISKPEATLQDLCHWLKEDFHENLLKDQKANSSFSDEKKQKGFMTSTVDRWQKSLDPKQIALTNLMTGKLHEYFDIKAYTPKLSLLDRLIFPFFYINEALKIIYGKAEMFLKYTK